MDGQNFQNEQGSTNNDVMPANNYQDNTANVQYQQYEETAPANTGDGKATVSLVMGILAIVFSCCCGIGLIFGIIGLICALSSKKKGNTSGVVTAGMICSIIGIIFGVLGLIYWIYCFAIGMSTYAAMEEAGIYSDLYNSYY